MNKNDIYELKLITIIFIVVFSFLSFTLGTIPGKSGVVECKYESIGSRINLPYVLGCELTKPRFKK